MRFLDCFSPVWYDNKIWGRLYVRSHVDTAHDTLQVMGDPSFSGQVLSPPSIPCNTYYRELPLLTPHPNKQKRVGTPLFFFIKGGNWGGIPGGLYEKTHFHFDVSSILSAVTADRLCSKGQAVLRRSGHAVYVACIRQPDQITAEYCHR